MTPVCVRPWHLQLLRGRLQLRAEGGADSDTLRLCRSEMLVAHIGGHIEDKPKIPENITSDESLGEPWLGRLSRLGVIL